MRLRVYNTPRVFDCSWEDEAFLGIPRGCMDALAELLESCGVPYALEDRRETGRPIAVSFQGELRPEQSPAAEALLAHNMGVLSATTAFGKTVAGAYLIGQRRVNTLILVHSSTLLEQWKGTLERFLRIEEPLPEPPKKRGRKKRLERVGQIGAGKRTRSGIVDVAIMQSLFKGEDKAVKPFVAEYGMVLCDECRHVAASTFEKILRAAKARYVYGLSATPVRQDGHQPIIFMQCGPVCYRVNAKSQADKRSFDQYVIPRFTRTRLPAVRKIQDAYAGIVKNNARNGLIISDAAGRLHRSCAGKQEVRIYDYVDLHVPVLERMYHRRLKGYADLGYQVKLAAGDGSSSRIYDGRNYLEPFARDLREAAESVLIVSLFVKQSRLQMLRPALDKALESGVSVTVRTRPGEDAAALLEDWGITVETREELWQRWAVIDKAVVWYGGIDYLSYSAKDANALRFESADIAGEVLELREPAGLPEQISIEEPYS